MIELPAMFPIFETTHFHGVLNICWNQLASELSFKRIVFGMCSTSSQSVFDIFHTMSVFTVHFPVVYQKFFIYDVKSLICYFLFF